jgi:DNA mismatch repair protein MutL
MGVIRILPDEVANRIAAGEVVERPASVVKELIENSLDAGARHIRVEIEGGGRRRIRVTDDGCGMLRDDALLAFERHATSKLRDASDLLAIPTLGFRGEALPSIGAVSRLTLETCLREPGAVGTRVEVAGGRMRSVSDAGLPPGTSITVENLFYNIPARRKFLKTDTTELGHIATLVTHYALAFPELHFELETAHRGILNTPPVARHADRLQQLFGAEMLGQLIEVNASVSWPAVPEASPFSVAAEITNGELPANAPAGPSSETAGLPDAAGLAAAGEQSLAIYGFISRPELQKLNRDSIYTFVNRRLVRDRVVQHAVSEAYRNLLPNGVYPVVLLFLDLPYGEVDANVHPSKVEVRFRRPAFVHDAIRDAARRALSEALPIPSFVRELNARPTAGATLSPGAAAILEESRAEESRAEQSRATQRNSGMQAFPPFDSRADPGSGVDSSHTAAGAESWRGDEVGNGGAVGAPFRFNSPPDFRLTPELPAPMAQPLPFDGAAAPGAAYSEARTGVVAGAPMGATARPPEFVDEPRRGCETAFDAIAPAGPLDLRELRPLGQIRESFIVAANRNGLWLVDQHVAHERVLFEKIEAQRLANQVERQVLLMPIVVELDPGRWVRFGDIAEELNRSGFEVEPFGTRSVAVKSVPAGIAAERTHALLQELLDAGEREAHETSLDRLRTRVAATIACHAAVKVNMPLDMEKMRWLLAELGATRFPMTCPHGRPVLLHYSMQEIQRAFKRI